VEKLSKLAHQIKNFYYSNADQSIIDYQLAQYCYSLLENSSIFQPNCDLNQSTNVSPYFQHLQLTEDRLCARNHYYESLPIRSSYAINSGTYFFEVLLL